VVLRLDHRALSDDGDIGFLRLHWVVEREWMILSFACGLTSCHSPMQFVSRFCSEAIGG